VRILFLTQWFAPEPHFKGLPLARELQRQGHEVVVLTGFPNYPGGKVYPGYRIRLWQREQMDGVEVLRVALYPSHSQSALGRMLNYATFALSATIPGLLLVREVDVAYVYHPPATVGLPALAFRWLRHVPCVYDVQDLWPDTLTATGMMQAGFLLSLAGWWSNFVYMHMDRIVVLSPGFKRCLVERGVRPEAIQVIYNWSPDAGASGPTSGLDLAEQQQLAGRFNVLFAGNMGPAQALETVIEAAALVQPVSSKVQFILAGGGVGVESLRRSAKKRGLSNVLFMARRPAGAMASLYAAVDVLLVHLRDDPLFAITIPSKTQTYLAAGRPLIVAVRGDAARLVQEAEAGLVCEPQQPSKLADAVRELMQMPAEARERMGRCGRTFYLSRLDMPMGISALLAALKDVERRGQNGPVT